MDENAVAAATGFGNSLTDNTWYQRRANAEIAQLEADARLLNAQATSIEFETEQRRQYAADFLARQKEDKPF